MLPTVPTPLAPSKVPSTKTWLLLLSLLTTLLVINHQVQPPPGALSEEAGRPATAPHRAELSRPAARPSVTFAASASL